VPTHAVSYKSLSIYWGFVPRKKIAILQAANRHRIRSCVSVPAGERARGEIFAERSIVSSRTLLSSKFCDGPFLYPRMKRGNQQAYLVDYYLLV
jgi:hypothetical protein